MSQSPTAHKRPQGPSRAPKSSQRRPDPSSPRELPLRLIDEDPLQPRGLNNPGFSAKSIAEIGQTIKVRGVKSPISVRDNPEVPGRYLINHGARRYRGSIWAGKRSIPAFIDNDYNEADRVIENLQRNELTAREIADFIGRELAKGKKKSAIALEIGKSPAFVSQHVTLLDLPTPIAAVFARGRIRDVTVINELVSMRKRSPQAVDSWLADESQELTRGTIGLLREFIRLRQQLAQDEDEQTRAAAHPADAMPPAPVTTRRRKRGQSPVTASRKLPIVQVRHGRRSARVLLERLPQANGRAWVRYDDTGEQADVELAKLRLVEILEG